MKLRAIAITLTSLIVLATSCTDAEPSDLGDRCTLNSDCRAPLVCGFERCRQQCATSRDCAGTACVKGPDGVSVCQLADEVECTHNSHCPGTQLCGPDRKCRDECISNKDCLADQQCVSRVCARDDELTASGTLPPADPAGVQCVYASDCPDELVCLYGHCTVECLGEKDCKIGWHCRAESGGGDGRCWPNTPTPDGGDGGGGDGGGVGGVVDQGVLVAGGTYSPETCVLLDDRSVKCWGSNNWGKLGQGFEGSYEGAMGDALPPINLGGGRKASYLAVGEDHTCAVLTDGAVKCWGANYAGQLGQGDTLERGGAADTLGDELPPIALGTGRKALAVVAGQQHTCALLDDHSVKCWGSNDEGQVGAGFMFDGGGFGTTVASMGDGLPRVNLGTGRTALAIAAGGAHTCAVLDDRSVKCWGANEYGQLGLGDDEPRGTTPESMGDGLPRVNLGTGRTALAIATKGTHTCAVLDDRSVKCWGANNSVLETGGSGQLGYGDFDNRGDRPGTMGDALPAVDLGTGRTARAVATSYGHTCALLDDHSVKCWGNNGFGQLGLGSSDAHGDEPGTMGDALPRVDLGAGRTALAITVGPAHSCALLDDRSVKCWGSNYEGELGLGDFVHRGGLPGSMGDALPAVSLGAGRTAFW